MAFVSREAIFSALFTLLSKTTPDMVGGSWQTTSRDLLQWDDVQPADQPALFLVETAQHASEPNLALSQWRLGALLIIYYRADGLADRSDPSTPRDSVVNAILDVIDAAITPAPGQRQTLGGLVYHTYIDGAVTFDSGLTDQQAVIAIPITMLVGSFGI